MATRFVPGIHNYCNRWCERCAKTSVCLVFASEEHHRALVEGRESRDPFEELGPPTPEAQAFMKELLEAQEQMTDADVRAFERDEALVTRYVADDPLTPLGKAAARALFEWYRRASGREIADPLLFEAREIIGHYGVMLGPKIHRALHGLYFARVHEDDFSDDANGTAKLTLLAIDELLPAVEAVAMTSPRDRDLRLALANLPALRSLLHERFPDAMAYVREGWDEG